MMDVHIHADKPWEDCWEGAKLSQDLAKELKAVLCQ